MDHPGAGGHQPAGGVVVVPMEAAAAPAAAGAWPVWTRARARVVLAAALFLLGCAAAGLALFTLILSPADSILGKACAPPTDAEVARLRTASECLLLAASAQVVVATMGLLLPARFVAFFGNLVGMITAYHTTDVLVKLVASCDDSVNGHLAFHYWFLYVLLLPAFIICIVVSLL